MADELPEEKPKKDYEIVDNLIDLDLVARQVQKGTLICEAYATGKYTIDSCCENQGISYRTFNDWLKCNSTVADLYKKAKGEADRATRVELKQKCMTSLMKLIEGHSVEEIHQSGTPILDKDGKQIGMKNGAVKRIKKHFAPNVTAVIFALKALDPEMYKDNVPVTETEEQVFLIGGKEIKF